MRGAVAEKVYYAAVSAVSLHELKCPGADSPAGDDAKLVVGKLADVAQGFYKVWVSDAAKNAED